jgi:Transposase Tn5 dimerisation domain
MPDTHVISVTDREADIHEVFDEHRKNPCPNLDLLVRAKHNRSIDGGEKLFAAVKDSPECGRFIIPVDRKSARAKKSKQKASPKRSKRMAEVSLRYKSVKLNPPLGADRDTLPIPVTIIHVVEEHPPEGEEGLEWFLLTTVNVQSAEDARDCLQWYCKRWRIEDWHRVLKSGCCIDDAAHKTSERLKRSIAISLVIAWRIMLMTLLGREVPNLPAEVLFSDIEIEVLTAVAKERTLDKPDNIGNAVQLVARLGGYLARNNDPPPGHQLMWKGYIMLRAMCAGYALRC